MAGEVRGDEQQVAHLLGQRRPVAVAGRDQLGRLLLQLVQHRLGRRPVEAHARGPVLQLHRPGQRRQAERHPVEHAPGRGAGALPGLDRLPVTDLLLGRLVAALVAEDMRVAGDQLVRDRPRHVREVEHPRLLGHPGVEHDLQQQVAELARQLVPGLPGDGVGDLVRLLDGVGGDRGEILLDIPGTAGRRIAQRRHDGDQACGLGLGLHAVGHGRCPAIPASRPTCHSPRPESITPAPNRVAAR